MTCSYSTVGSANIILAANEADTSGVPKQVLENLPKIAFGKLRPANSSSELTTESSTPCTEDSAQQNTRVDLASELGDESVDLVEKNAVIAGDDREPASGLAVDPDDLSSSAIEPSAACLPASGSESCPQLETITCEICQCDYESSDDVTVLPCKHFYHQPCIGWTFEILSTWFQPNLCCRKCRSHSELQFLLLWQIPFFIVCFVGRAMVGPEHNMP